MTDTGREERYVIVLNPASGRGRGGAVRPQLEALLRRCAAELTETRAVAWEIVETCARGDGTRLAAEAVAGGADVVVAAGGDGTLGEVVNGVAGTDVQLGLLPLGTGNDFARSLGLGGGLEAAFHALFHGDVRPVDLGRAGDRWFINVAGCGFDAIVAERVNAGFRYLRGTGAYLAAVVESLTKLRPATMRVTLDGELREFRGLLCAVANAPMYGGGMKIAPQACIDDGYLDVCTIGDASVAEFLCAFPRVFAGTHATHPKVTMARARRVLVETDPPLPVLIDGEVTGTTPMEFTICPGAIQLRMPRL